MTTPKHRPNRYTDNEARRASSIYLYIYFYIVSVRLSVCVVDHALMAVLIDFIFDMHIDVIPGSDIGILFFHFCSLKIIYGQGIYFEGLDEAGMRPRYLL